MVYAPQGSLSLEEVCGGVMLVKAVAAINSAVSSSSEQLLFKALSDSTAHLQVTFCFLFYCYN